MYSMSFFKQITVVYLWVRFPIKIIQNSNYQLKQIKLYMIIDY